MTARDLFGVVLRSMGVWIIVEGLLQAFAILFRMADASSAFMAPATAVEKLLVACDLGMGLLLIVLADRIVRFIYKG